METVQAISAALSPIIWPLLVLVIFLVFRARIVGVLNILQERIKSGAEIEIANFKLGKVPFVDAAGKNLHVTGRTSDHAVEVIEDDGKQDENREKIYTNNRCIFLVHVLRTSNQSRYLFDITIYLTTHREGSLLGIKYVDYYFGPMWKKRLFRISSRFNAFAISTSAYGPFLCVAEAVFHDGSRVKLSRYIDFEMGSAAPRSLMMESTSE